MFYKKDIDGYIETSKINEKYGKSGLILGLIAIFIALAIILPLSFIYGVDISRIIEKFQGDNPWNYVIALIIFVIAVILNIIIHELIHGLFFKLFAPKEKLNFGITFGSAYCGMANVYLKKIPTIIISLAPFIILGALYITPIFFITDEFYYLLNLILLAFHVGGSISDIYFVFLLIFKFKGDILINDIGPTQTIYKRKDDLNV